MTCGIYSILNTSTGQQYIGSSIEIENRIRRHLKELMSNKHPNQYLQNSFNKYGESQFSTRIVETCDNTLLLEREQYWIDNTKDTFNIRKYVNDLHGERNPFFGKTHTIEFKRRLSEKNKKAYLGEKNPNYGKKNSLEVRLKMSEGRARLEKAEVQEIVRLIKEGVSHTEIACTFDIARSTITRIANGTRWTNLTGGAIEDHRKSNLNLSDEQIIQIIDLIKNSSLLYKNIANQFGIKENIIAQIASGRLYRRLSGGIICHRRKKEK